MAVERKTEHKIQNKCFGTGMMVFAVAGPEAGGTAVLGCIVVGAVFDIAAERARQKIVNRGEGG